MTHPQRKRVRRRIGLQPIGRGRGKKLGLRKRRKYPSPVRRLIVSKS